MKKLKAFSALSMCLLALCLALASCDENNDDNGNNNGNSSIPTFTDVAAFSTWLDSQPTNTKNNPYSVALNLSSFDGLSTVLQNASNKYVNLDLSGSKATSIEAWAFHACTRLIGVILPNSLTSIGERAFYECINLTSISTIPDSVTSIGSWAFHYCTCLTEINVAAGNNAFTTENGVLFNKNKTTLIKYPEGKTGSFTIPNSVTSIGNGAFSYSTALITITIPDSVTSIGDDAFAVCRNLNNLIIPNSVTSIGSGAFGRAGFTSVTIGTGVTNIPNNAFSDCTSLKSVTIPDSVTSIESSAFADCTSLNNVTIGTGVTSLGHGVFYHCTSLKSVNIPSRVTSIPESAFYECTSLVSITIPDNITNIWNNAFIGCTSLASVTFQGTIASSNFRNYYAFYGDLCAKFYETNPNNGTPGTYTTSSPVSNSSVWTLQP